MKNRKKRFLILALIAILVVSTGATTAYLFTKTSTVVNTFFNEDPYGSIKISKTVEHPYGENYVIPDNKVFTFQVDFGKECANMECGQFKADENGIITLKLNAGEAKIITEIPEGKRAVIEEVDIPDGFSVKNGNSRTVTVKKSEMENVDFVNTYRSGTAKSEGLSVEGTKVIDGREWKENDSFSMNLEMYTGSGWKKIANAKTTKSNRGFDFTEAIRKVSFDERKTYSFRVYEDEGNLEGMVYDTSIGMFDVIVDDADMDGELEITDVRSYSDCVTVSKNDEKGEKNVNVRFINKYENTLDPTDVIIEYAHLNITKRVTDSSGQEKSPAGYHFEIYDQESENKLGELETSAAGENSFGIACDKNDIGTRTLIVKEVRGNEPGITYDNTQYRIKLEVEENSEDGIKVKLYDAKHEKAPKDADNKYSVSFKNKYDPDNPVMKIKGSKELKGRSIKNGEFEADLYETDSTYETEGTPSGKQKIKSDGTFEFNITYSEPGTYYYVVKEKNNNIPGISYDDSEYMVKADVTDEGGKLKADYEILNGYGSKNEIKFRNIYVPESEKTVISGVKKLEGKTLQSGRYTFELCRTDSDFANEEAIDTAVNNVSGRFSFKEITYDEEGTYYYTVKEKADNPEKNVKYDKTVYRITVDVKDNGSGKLSIEKKYATAGGKADGIIFTNVFEADYASLDITAKKSLSGKKLEDGMFEFVLYRTNSDYKYSDAKATYTKNSANGNVCFSNVRFDKEGTYYFVVKEKQPRNRKGITFDKSEYRITVNVKPDNDGQLIAKITSIEKKGDGEVSSIIFHNSFSGSDVVTKTGDNMKLLLWLALMILSSAGIVITFIRGFSRRKYN